MPIWSVTKTGRNGKYFGAITGLSLNSKQCIFRLPRNVRQKSFSRQLGTPHPIRHHMKQVVVLRRSGFAKKVSPSQAT